MTGSAKRSLAVRVWEKETSAKPSAKLLNFGFGGRGDLMPRSNASLQGSSADSQSAPEVAFQTGRGVLIKGRAERALASDLLNEYKGKAQLIFTSPPFPLNRKKKYGNETGEKYVEWLASFADSFREYLRPDGSIVIELGNAWEPGAPVMSPLALEALLAFRKAGSFSLCQQFVCFNRARLPSPAQWVNVERIRLKDAYTHVWWMAPTPRPKADNRAVLVPYSESMKRLLETKKYNAGPRPSEHHIGAESFFKNNGGAIPSNVLEFSNTAASDDYLKYCRQNGLQPHPARMHSGLADFFIRFLTEPRNLVMDPFAGSNTTGAVAERLKRRWVSIEPNDEYIQGSRGRFEADGVQS
ncbi:MAG: DNA-methyltransferase [Methanobacteriota archaeon]